MAMSREELDNLRRELLRELQDGFVLIPKRRMWHFLGGAASFAILAFGLSFAGALAGLRTSSAQEAVERISELKEQAEQHVAKLEPIANYLHNGSEVVLVVPGYGSNHLSISRGGNVRATGTNFGTDEVFVLKQVP